MILLLVGGELLARFYLGLGEPPLSMADPQIEYLFQPNQTCHRFGNLIHYNAWSMRSDDFPEHKSGPRELRVLMIGDSVINGGALTDQKQLASSILERSLSSDLDQPVVVGNISAASWGPPNALAYVKKFGLFDADVVVIVLSSHDYGDAPTFEPVVGVAPDFPDRRPMLALSEGIWRYLPRYVPWVRRLGIGGSGPDPAVPVDKQPTAKEIDSCLSAERELVELTRRSGAAVIVALYLAPKEVDAGKPDVGHDLLQKVAEESSATVVQLGPAFERSRKAGESPYRDVIHPTARGQQLIAQTLLPVIEEALRQREADHAPAPAPATATSQSVDAAGNGR